jgi:hypothetical protein
MRKFVTIIAAKIAVTGRLNEKFWSRTDGHPLTRNN